MEADEGQVNGGKKPDPHKIKRKTASTVTCFHGWPRFDWLTAQCMSLLSSHTLFLEACPDPLKVGCGSRSGACSSTAELCQCTEQFLLGDSKQTHKHNKLVRQRQRLHHILPAWHHRMAQVYNGFPFTSAHKKMVWNSCRHNYKLHSRYWVTNTNMIHFSCLKMANGGFCIHGEPSGPP